MTIKWLPIIQKLSPSLFKFFLARFPRQEADELVQEVFLRLFSKIESGDFDESRGTFEALAWGIALNISKENWRHTGLKLVGLEESSKIAPEQNNDALEVRKAVGELEEPEKTVMQLLLSDLSLSKIAELTRMPEGTVKSHVHRAKKNLKTQLLKWRPK